MKLPIILPAILGLALLSGCVEERVYTRGGRYYDSGPAVVGYETYYVQGRPYTGYHEGRYYREGNYDRYYRNDRYADRRDDHRDDHRNDHHDNYRPNNYNASQQKYANGHLSVQYRNQQAQQQYQQKPNEYRGQNTDSKKKKKDKDHNN